MVEAAKHDIEKRRRPQNKYSGALSCSLLIQWIDKGTDESVFEEPELLSTVIRIKFIYLAMKTEMRKQIYRAKLRQKGTEEDHQFRSRYHTHFNYAFIHFYTQHFVVPDGLISYNVSRQIGTFERRLLGI